MTGSIDLNPNHLAIVLGILAEHVPECEVRAFGSRASWTSRDYSDLDLAIVGEGALDWRTLGRLKEAFEESSLPMRVDVLDWHATSESFREVIERDYVVVQEGADQTTAGEWREVALGNVAQVRSGYAFKSAGWTSIGIPVVKIANVKGGKLAMEGCAYVSPTVASQAGRFNLQEEDILIALTGYIGDVALVRNRDLPAVLNQRVGLFSVLDKSRLNNNFLFQLLRNPDMRESIEGLGYGSAQPNVSPTLIHNVTISLPPLADQRTIAHVLGSLDAKIEINRRMNETLEAMARALFKSWFVDFDPVRAKMEGRWLRGKSLPGLPAEHYDLFPDQLVSSEIGKIPEGWEVKPLGRFGEIITGKTPSTKLPEYFGEEVPFLRIPDMHGNMYALHTEVMLAAQGAESQSKKTLPPGSVSVSCIATPGLVVLNHRYTQTNQQINSIIPYDQSLSRYLYWTCSHLSSDIATGGLGGSVFGNMNKSTFSALLAIHPEPTIVRAFDALVSPIHTAILANEEQAHALVAQRDALLPRLVSGEVRVQSN